MAPRALTFDFYNTLVRHRGEEGRSAAFRKYLATHGLTARWSHASLYALFEDFDPAAGEDRIWPDLARRALALAGLGHVTADPHVKDLRAIFGPAALEVYPEVPAALARLRQRSLSLAVVSNWPRGLTYFLRELGLLAYFDHALCSAEVGWQKPDVRIFEAACASLDQPPAHVVHVGDHPEEDIEGAVAAGMNAILVAREGPAASPVPVISTLDELDAALADG